MERIEVVGKEKKRNRSVVQTIFASIACFVGLAVQRFRYPTFADALTLDCPKCINRLVTLFSGFVEILLTMFSIYFIGSLFFHCTVAVVKLPHLCKSVGHQAPPLHLVPITHFPSCKQVQSTNVCSLCHHLPNFCDAE